MPFKDITGQHFGQYLTAMWPVGRRSNSTAWLFSCNCPTPRCRKYIHTTHKAVRRFDRVGCGKHYTQARRELMSLKLRGMTWNPNQRLNDNSHRIKMGRHVITNVSEELLTATCSICGPVPVSPHKSTNSYFCRVRSCGAKVSFWGEALQKWNEQKGICKICNKEMKLSGNESSSVNLDHDRTPGLIRWFLHSRCNKGIGLFCEDTQSLMNAVQYLKDCRDPLREKIVA